MTATAIKKPVAPVTPVATAKPSAVNPALTATQSAALADPSKALNEIEYLKKQWESGTKGQQTWASQQAAQYYNTLDPAEAAKVRGMNAAQLAEYRKGKVAPVTGSIDGLGQAIVDGIGQSPATYGDSQDTIRDTIAEQSNNNTPSNNLMDLFNEAIKTAGDPNSEYWDVFRELANQQAKGDVEMKQQKLDAARSGIDDKFFQEYLQSRQGMANRGLGNSGLANDSDFRLQLAKQGQLANMYSELGTFDKDSIAADKFKSLYDQGTDTMMKKADSLKDMYGQASQYDKISTQDLLKQLFSYDQLATQDKWNDVESLLGLRGQDIDQAQFKEQSKQFYDRLGQEKQIEAAKIGFDYDKLGVEQKQFYDQLNQNGVVETARLDMQLRQLGLDVTKVMGVDANGNATLDARKLSEEVRHNVQSEIQSGNSLIAQMGQWAEQNRLDAGKLDLDEREFGFRQTYDQAMLDSAAANATNDAQKQKIDILKTQMGDISSQINAVIRSGKEPSKELKDQYNAILGQVNTALGGSGK
jgi:hypothetical protein